jgi:BirA family biotin operon repressor/biotin-[acetyl-CoA-carboxylase] ligase
MSDAGVGHRARFRSGRCRLAGIRPLEDPELVTGHVGPDLDAAAALVRARGGRLGIPLHLLAETESTNDDAKAAARQGAPHGAVWVAETQVHGRGRQGRAWVSPRGENLLFSVLLRISCAPTRVPLVSLAAGLAVRDAVANAIGDDDRVLVKWPNDVVISGASYRKIAGVLVESALAGSKVEHVVVGIGVNVHTRVFEGDLASTATSIALESSRTVDRGELLADILAALDHDVEHVVHRGLGVVLGRLSKHDALVGRAVSTDDGRVCGCAKGIDPDGRLLVERPDGAVVRVASGEVHLRAV